MNKFKVVVPFYNVEKWVKHTIDGVKKQQYSNYECIFSDDISTDNSCKIIEENINERIFLKKTEKKQYALENIYNSISYMNCTDEDIIVLLDGDDWFPNEQTLEILNKYYSNEETLMTYGTYIEYPSRRIPTNVSPFSENVIKNNLYRQDIWRASHLRTFKYKLWKNIAIEDLKDDSGKFYKMTWDLAIMFPMLEMSGGKHKCISELMYCYNTSNPINDHKVDHAYQLKLETEIRNKKKYEKIF